MKSLMSFVSVLTAISLAAPAYGEPDGEDGAFLAALQNAGFTYSSPGQVITSAKAVCGFIGKGETGLQVVRDIKDQNPGMTMDDAARFAAIASNAYCPEHLMPKVR